MHNNIIILYYGKLNSMFLGRFHGSGYYWKVFWIHNKRGRKSNINGNSRNKFLVLVFTAPIIHTCLYVRIKVGIVVL